MLSSSHVLNFSESRPSHLVSFPFEHAGTTGCLLPARSARAARPAGAQAPAARLSSMQFSALSAAFYTAIPPLSRSWLAAGPISVRVGPLRCAARAKSSPFPPCPLPLARLPRHGHGAPGSVSLPSCSPRGRPGVARSYSVLRRGSVIRHVCRHSLHEPRRSGGARARGARPDGRARSLRCLRCPHRCRPHRCQPPLHGRVRFRHRRGRCGDWH